VHRLGTVVDSLTVATLLAWGLLATAAKAQAPSSPAGGAALAQALFDDAKARMANNDFATACPKFAESYRLDPAAGTLVGLALCHEGEGKSASAWAEFLLVAREAKKSGRTDREQLAREHVAKLEPHLSRISIAVADEARAGPGFEVKRDGVVVAPAAWRTAVPADPGIHLVEASAPGKSPWRTEVRVGSADDDVAVAIPPLVDDGSPVHAEPLAADAPGAAPSRAHRWKMPASAAIVGGAGIVAIGVGAYFGVNALSESNVAKSDCSTSLCRDPASVAKSHDAVRDADIADVGIGAGLVGLAVGLYLALTSDSTTGEPAPKMAIVPRVEPGRAFLSVAARW